MAEGGFQTTSASIAESLEDTVREADKNVDKRQHFITELYQLGSTPRRQQERIDEALRVAVQLECNALLRVLLVDYGFAPDLEDPGVLTSFACLTNKSLNILGQHLCQAQPKLIDLVLYSCIRASHVSLATTFLDNRPNIDWQDAAGTSALMVASECGQDGLVKKILDRGATVNLANNAGRTALSAACAAGHERIVRILLDNGADPKHVDKAGWSCGQLATKAKKLVIVEMLGCDSTNKEALLPPKKGQIFDNPKLRPFFVIKPAQDAIKIIQQREAESRNRQEDAVVSMYNKGRSSRAQPSSAAPLPNLRGRSRASFNPENGDKERSKELHELLNSAGFTSERAQLQVSCAEQVQQIARELLQDNRQMTGSYAEGWANSLIQVDGRTAPDSDIDWTVMLSSGPTLHLKGGCGCRGQHRLTEVVEGHALVDMPTGSQPAVSVPGCGVRPAQDTCFAYQCCSCYCEDRALLLLPKLSGTVDTRVHLVRATRPDSTNELRVSFSFLEKQILRGLNTVQGQLFVLLKLVIKRILPEKLNAHVLKSYHAKTILFFMLERHQRDPSKWRSEWLVTLLRESLDLLLDFLCDQDAQPSVCMPHFFMPDAPLFFKNAGTGVLPEQTKMRLCSEVQALRQDLSQVFKAAKASMKPLRSESFYFQPFTMLPLDPSGQDRYMDRQFAQQSPDAEFYTSVKNAVMRISQMRETECERLLVELDFPLFRGKEKNCVKQCLRLMTLLKLEKADEAKQLVEGLKDPEIWSLTKYTRWCFPCRQQPDFKFLLTVPTFKPQQTQATEDLQLQAETEDEEWKPKSGIAPSLLKLKSSAPILYVNFCCLLWSIRAELCEPDTSERDQWERRIEGNPDIEELFALASYSKNLRQVRRCKRRMDYLAIESGNDKEKLEEIYNKIKLLESEEEYEQKMHGKFAKFKVLSNRNPFPVPPVPQQPPSSLLRLLERMPFSPRVTSARSNTSAGPTAQGASGEAADAQSEDEQFP